MNMKCRCEKNGEKTTVIQMQNKAKRKQSKKFFMFKKGDNFYLWLSDVEGQSALSLLRYSQKAHTR
jgi:hypothetical protein